MRRSLSSPLWAVFAVGLLTYLVVDARDNRGNTPEPKTVETRIGNLQFESGYPSRATVGKLYDEMDFQRACQAYLWGIPAVSLNEWRHAHEDVFKVRNGQWILMITREEKIGILTPNNTTPYLVSTVDLAKTGPFVIELPPGEIAGMMIDVWQRYLDDLGVFGPHKNRGGKYLVLPPGHEELKPEGYRVLRPDTNTVFFGLRLLDQNENEAIERLVPGIRSYPWSERMNPPKEQAVRAGNKDWSQVPPRGMKFWERLAEIIQNEPVQERDRLILAQLRFLGIEKGKPFKPDGRQKKLLEAAALVGEAMAKTNAFDKRVEPVFWPNTHWKHALVVSIDQRKPGFDQLDERASWFYEAVTISRAMLTEEAGKGQRYIAAYQDKNGDWLTGGKSYRLRVTADPPAEQFWSVTVYDQSTRQFIANPSRSPDVSSRTEGLKKNKDGSFDIYFGPTPPKGFEKNWIQTNPGDGFFLYFRLFAPTQRFFDKTWTLPDVEPL